MITSQEMLADLSYRLDTQFEVLYADNEKVLGQMTNLGESTRNHANKLKKLAEELERTQKNASDANQILRVDVRFDEKTRR